MEPLPNTIMSLPGCFFMAAIWCRSNSRTGREFFQVTSFRVREQTRFVMLFSAVATGACSDERRPGLWGSGTVPDASTTASGQNAAKSSYVRRPNSAVSNFGISCAATLPAPYPARPNPSCLRDRQSTRRRSRSRTLRSVARILYSRLISLAPCRLTSEFGGRRRRFAAKKGWFSYHGCTHRCTASAESAGVVLKHIFAFGACA
jgi:hypothetical protein